MDDSKRQGHLSSAQPPTAKGSEIAGVVRRNISALLAVRQANERRRTFGEVAAQRITTFTGSMRFVLLHAIIFGAWIVINLGAIPGVRPFDPFPFVMLAMIASVEAIFLSTFVLISQNQMTEIAEKRADLDLQVNLLAEHEVTRLIHMLEAVARKVGVDLSGEPGLEELKKDVEPEVVLGEIDRASEQRPS